MDQLDDAKMDDTLEQNIRNIRNIRITFPDSDSIDVSETLLMRIPWFHSIDFDFCEIDNGTELEMNAKIATIHLPHFSGFFKRLLDFLTHDKSIDYVPAHPFLELTDEQFYQKQVREDWMGLHYFNLSVTTFEKYIEKSHIMRCERVLRALNIFPNTDSYDRELTLCYQYFVGGNKPDSKVLLFYLLKIYEYSVYKNELLWTPVCMYQNQSDEWWESHSDTLDWYFMVYNPFISQSFVNRHISRFRRDRPNDLLEYVYCADKLDMFKSDIQWYKDNDKAYRLSFNRFLTEDFFETHFSDQDYWTPLFLHPNVSECFLTKHIEAIAKSQNDLCKYDNRFQQGVLFKPNLNLSEDFFEKHIHRFSISWHFLVACLINPNVSVTFLIRHEHIFKSFLLQQKRCITILFQVYNKIFNTNTLPWNTTWNDSFSKPGINV